MELLGRPVAQKIYTEISKEILNLKSKKIIPSLAVVLVGDNPASLSYVRKKEEMCEGLKIDFKLFHLPGIATQKQVEAILDELNCNKFVTGIVVQLPLPDDFETDKILEKIDPLKDIDGFYSDYPAPTAQAILEILKYYKINLQNKKIVLLGHGRLVGKPLAKLLKRQNIKPEICDKNTLNLIEKLQQADIIISATGVPGLIKKNMVDSKTIIIDAGTAEANGKIVGDVQKSVHEKVKAYSPVPGGVGPVTVACLMKNLIAASK